MKTFRTIGQTAAVMMMLSIAVAQAAILPGEAIGEDVVAVVWLDAARLEGKPLQAAAAALLGDEAKQLAEPLGQLEKMREPFVKAGGTGLAVVFRGPNEEGRPPEPYVLIPLADRTNPDEALAAIKAIAGGPVEKFSDRCLIAVPPRWRPQPVEAGERHKAIEKLLAAQGGAPAAIVFIPNDALRQLFVQQKPALPAMEEQVPGITSLFEFGQQASSMKSITLVATLGDAPKLSLAADGADAEAVKTLQEKMKAASEGMKKMEAKMKAQGRLGGDSALSMRVFSALLAGETKAAGTQMTMTLQGEPLKQSAVLVMRGVMEARKAAARAAVASHIRQVSIAIIAYSNDHQGSLPDSLDDVAEFVDGKEALAKLLTHPVTGEKVGILYVKPAKKLNDVKQPSITAILFEAQGGKIMEGGFIGYADGSVRRDPPRPPADDVRK